MSYVPLLDYDTTFLPADFWEYKGEWDVTPLHRCKECGRRDSANRAVDPDTLVCTDCTAGVDISAEVWYNEGNGAGNSKEM